MKKQDLPESVTLAGKPPQLASEYWFDDACLLDMDHFVKSVAGLKSQGISPDLIGSIITHYAPKWLPDLTEKHHNTKQNKSPESVTTSWMKKRFFVETLVGILPPDRDSISCSFLFRLLKTANLVGVEPTCRAELERRISYQLDQATIKDLMIPSFSHTCATVLDIELVVRLVQRFVNLDDVTKSGAALAKVAKLVDCYLAEAAIDSNLTMPEFVSLASAIPSHARAMEDGLYRSIDTYLKSHPEMTKQDRKALCGLMDCRKLSPEAAFHATLNDRLPIRTVIQVLFSEQSKLRNIDWSGSFSGTRSPNSTGLVQPGRCQSKREISTQQVEIRRLREDVVRLQGQCHSMQGQIDRLSEKKKGLFRWKKLVMPSFKSVNVVERIEGEGEIGLGRQTPIDMKTKLIKGRTPPKWRQSMS